MRKTVISIGTLMLIFFGQQASLSQETNAEKINIHLYVNGDEYYKNQVYSYIARELRLFNDVKIVDEGGRFEIRCLVVRPKYVTGETTGAIFIATAILDNLDKAILKVIMTVHFHESGKVLDEWTESLINKVSTFCTIWINSGPEKGVAEICKSIVTSFDAEYLENVRKTR